MLNAALGMLKILTGGLLALGLVGGVGSGAWQAASSNPPPTVVRDEAAKAMLLGRHLFSCQWISWEDFGRAEVTEENGTLRLTASQRLRDGSDYAEVEGIILEVQSKSFLFKGWIVTQIGHINEGRPCRREGTMTFRISGQRKYWRLKEMDNPCDGVVDYLDIYFRRPEGKE